MFFCKLKNDISLTSDVANYQSPNPPIWYPSLKWQQAQRIHVILHIWYIILEINTLRNLYASLYPWKKKCTHCKRLMDVNQQNKHATECKSKWNIVVEVRPIKMYSVLSLYFHIGKHDGILKKHAGAFRLEYFGTKETDCGDYVIFHVQNIFTYKYSPINMIIIWALNTCYLFGKLGKSIYPLCWNDNSWFSIAMD